MARMDESADAIRTAALESLAVPELTKSGIFEPKLSPEGGKIAYQDDGSI
jgi:hypothetical protein